MVEAQLNYFDMAVLGIMFLSCLFAFFRGFVREVLSLTAWVGAGIITVYFFKDVAKMLQPHFTEEKIALIFSFGGLYIGSLICFAIINRIIVRLVKSGTGIGMVDNFLGLLFGATRGALVISLGYFMLSVAVDKNNLPNWMAKAVTLPYVEKGAEMLAQLAPEHLKNLANVQKNAAIDLKNEMANEAKNQINGLAADKNQLENTIKNFSSDAQKNIGKNTGNTLDQILKDTGK